MVGGPEDALNNLEEQQLITEIITASNLTANVTFNITIVRGLFWQNFFLFSFKNTPLTSPTFIPPT